MVKRKKIDNVLRNKIRRIHISTKRIMQSALSGDYISAFKGSGLEFDQIRDYQRGDDVRFIDWNSVAKMNKIMVKQFIEERDRTIIIAIDISRSTQYSSSFELRQDTIAQISAALAFIAEENKDKVGILFFSDRIEKWIAPKHGNLHIGSIVEHIFSLKPTGTRTNLTEPLKFLINLKKRNAIVFMLSDWIYPLDKYSKLLKVASIEYDFVGIRILDEREKSFPDIGLLDITDPETGQTFTLDTSKSKTHKKTKNLNLFLAARALDEKKLFEKYRIDLLDLTVGKSFVNPLIKFFHKRIRRQI